MRPRLTRGALVMVGGHSRGVGKTLLIEEWLKHSTHTRWLALKVSAHRHASPSESRPLIEEAFDPAPTTQTGRYLSAGATRAFLVRAPATTLPRVAAFIARLRDQGANVIVESNRLVRYLQPALVLFVVDPGIDDWKASSMDCVSVPQVIFCRHRGGPNHDRHIVRLQVGNGAAIRARALHRVALSCTAAHDFRGTDCAR